MGIIDKGSIWRRWDPHIHAPGTLLADGFAGDWEAYLKQIESLQPGICALGITDYFCIRTYKRAVEFKAKGRLPNVSLLFANVELRLDLKTEKAKPINIHLLFSPDDPKHIEEIERILGRLSIDVRDRPRQCTETDLRAIGKLLHPEQTDEDALLRAGANQFKVTLTDLKELFRQDEWMRRNCLVAVAGNQNDGTSGLQGDSSFTVMRQEIERFAHIIFSATPQQREFWAGKKEGHDRALIEERYGFLKPCLHGSDAHSVEKVGAPEKERFCWLKGDATFETLRQAILEPERRVHIGPTEPSHDSPAISVDSVSVRGAPWLEVPDVSLNHGLVAVIGARGSGKTALVEMTAAGAGAADAGEGESSSFLRRARAPVNLIGEAEVEVTWGDGSKQAKALGRADNGFETEDAPEICYLSQQFVDRLCSTSGLATELRSEIERVIFEATDPTEKLGASSFSELQDQLLAPIRRRREQLRSAIEAASVEIVHEEELQQKAERLKKEKIVLAAKLVQAKKELERMVPKGREARAKRLVNVEQALVLAQAAIEVSKKRKQGLNDLSAEVKQIRAVTEPNRHAEMRRDFTSAQLSDLEWRAFAMAFSGDVDAILKAKLLEVNQSITLSTHGDTKNKIDKESSDFKNWPLTQLLAYRDELSKEVGVDTELVKKYNELQKSIGLLEKQAQGMDTEIALAEGSDARKQKIIQTRRDTFAKVFETFAEEEQKLNELHEPLSRELVGAKGALGRLSFAVHRHVDLTAWVTECESNLIDLRLDTRFRGHGALRKEADTRLLNTLARGTATQVTETMDAFRADVATELVKAMPRSITPSARPKWLQKFATWLYSTEHVSIEYSIRYEGTAIEQLSPGTRGIVLLLLFLAIDRHDLRPLIIDQPEENLDPKSVFDELVPHFRAARLRRQIIIVTHNANLVVNTDADQVIVASSTHTKDESLPTIAYAGGSIENPEIRRAVCEILEGGERAFLERERRYRIRWGESPETTAPDKDTPLQS